MLFNSLHFVLFLPIVIFLYFILKPKYRWILLLLASYYFYMSWKAEYALLILFSTIVDYFSALQMGKYDSKSKKKPFLLLSILVNLGMLAGFKYLNFISDSVRSFISLFQLQLDGPSLDILLPVGISFYTFQTLSYSIEVYRGNQKPEKHFGIFAVYVSFFPQLVAGPIERSVNLIPQFHKTNKFNQRNTVLGLRQMLIGYFKKIVIADNLGVIVDQIYNSPQDQNGFTLTIATIFFAFQIFADFSGYSDIAIGSARIMGYDLMQNFRQPYLSKSISEFWQRWHISLSTWFRDYVYIPLGGNRVAKWKWFYNLFLTFTVSGLWHGANWTFVFWGALNGIYLIFEIVIAKPLTHFVNSTRLSAFEPLLNEFRRAYVFILICFSWIFFRADSIDIAFQIIRNIYSELPLYLGKMIHQLFYSLDTSFLVETINQLGVSIRQFNIALVSLTLMFVYHRIEDKYDINTILDEKPRWFKWSFYYFILIYIFLFGNFQSNQFIYFQF